MARPSKLPIWNISEANAAEPPSSRQTDGWAITAGVPEKPPVEWHNYIWNLQYKWIDYLDTDKADKSGVSLTVDNVFELSEELASASTTAIVKDTDRGGVFVYDASQSGVNNGGTIFNGWVRQYDGSSVNVLWFGVKGDGVTDDRDSMQNAINNSRVVLIPKDTEIKLESGISLNSGNSIIGEDRYTSKILFSDYSTASYLNMIVLNDNVSISNLSINVIVPNGSLGGLLFVFPETDISNILIDSINVDMGLIETGGTLNTNNHLFVTAANGSASNVTIKNSYFTKFKFGILQTNTSTFGSYFWTIDNNKFENFYSPALTINCPSGDADNIKITNNFLNNSLAYTTGNSEHMGSVAGGSSTNNFLFQGNILTGTGQGWHFEEGAGIITVNGDIIKVNKTGIRILDNHIGGVRRIPSKFIITNCQIINTQGSPAEGGIQVVFDASGEPPLVDSIITNNLIENWDRGISLGESSNRLVVRDNLIRKCNEGLRTNYASGLKDNVFQECAICVLVRRRGGYIDELTYDGGIPITAENEIEGTVNKLNFNKNLFTLPDGNSDIVLFPADSSTEFDGVLTIRLYSIVGNRRNLSFDVSFDGTTLSQTAKVASGAGVVTFTSLSVTGGNLVATFNNTTGSAIDDCLFSASLNGFYATL